MSNNEKELAVLSQDKLMQTENSMSVDEYLAQLHADYDPVYSMLMNYQCAVMEVETKFNVLNNRLSIQGEHNPIESIKSRVKSLDSIIRKLQKDNLPITIESVEENGKKDMFVEVQLRTIAMDFWASLEHKLRYKKNLNPKTAEELAGELEVCAQASAELDEKMLRIRNRISEDTAASDA